MSESMPLPYGVRSRRRAADIINRNDLPWQIRTLITTVVRRTRLWRREKAQVAEELVAHFQDGLADNRSMEDLLRSFGDVCVAAQLIRRAKKRNRPLWWRALRKTMRGFVLFVVLYIVAALLMATRQPRVTVDYLAKFNELLPTAPADEQAWPIYRAALLAEGSKTFIEDIAAQARVDDQGRPDGPALCELSPRDPEWPKAVTAIQKHPLMVKAAREGGRKRVYGLKAGLPGDYSKEDQLALSSSWGRDATSKNPPPSGSLNVVRWNEFKQPFTWLAHALAMDSRLAATQGDVDRVIENYRSALGLARQASERSVNYSVHNWTWCYMIADQTLADIDRTFPQLLRGRRGELLRDMNNESPRFDNLSFAGERMFALDLVQRTYSDDGAGNGRLTYRGISTLVNDTSIPGSLTTLPWEERSGYIAALPAAAVAGASRKEVTERVNRIYDDAQRDAKLPMWQRLSAKPPIDLYPNDLAGRIDLYRNLPLLAAYPSIAGPTFQRDAARALHEATIVALALSQWREQHGAYPATLDPLIPSLLSRLPVDHSTGRPLRYTLLNGEPLLYGLGKNGADDGGAFSGNRNRWPIEVPASGDWLLHPPIPD